MIVWHQLRVMGSSSLLTIDRQVPGPRSGENGSTGVSRLFLLTRDYPAMVMRVIRELKPE